MKLLYNNALSANITVILVAFMVTQALQASIPPWLLWCWFALIGGFSLLRIWIWHRFQVARSSASPGQWARRYAWSTLAVGTAWGLLAGTIHHLDALILQNLIIILLMGIMVTGVTILAAYLPAFYAYILPQAVALVGALLLYGATTYSWFGVGTVLFTLLLIFTAIRSNRNIRRILELQYRNLGLITRLNDEIARRKTAQRQLEQHGEELEKLVASRTQQLVNANLDLEKEISERRRAEENLKHLAHHDPLTGLPNRLLLDARLEHAIQRAHRAGRQLAVLFLDLDRFKHVNDSLGHAIGDELLRQVSIRLRQCVREEDTISRLGGDEFVIVMEQVDGPGAAHRLAKKLMQALNDPFQIHRHTLFVDTSIGISIYPKDGHASDELLKNADAAMYQAKASGRNNFTFYTPHLTESAYDQLMLESCLRQALEQNEFELHYQPQISLSDGRIIGVEALIRWRHPKWGLVSPARFLPLAEESGLIVPIGNWVLRSACLQMSEWQAAGVGLERMAVNMAGKQLRADRLVETVTTTLAETGCQPQWLELEVTEGFIVQETDHAIQALEQLRQMGIHLAIDDFGTGYSSLSHLKRLPIDKLKIDRSFVRDLAKDPNDAAIVRAIIAMGHSLQMEIIAEGVENQFQERFLRREHCHQAQGFRYSRPLPANRIPQLLQRLKNGGIGRC